MEKIKQIIIITLIVISGLLMLMTVPKEFLWLASLIWLVIAYKLVEIPFWCITTVLGLLMVIGNGLDLYMKTANDLTIKGYDYLFSWLLNEASWMVKHIDQNVLHLTILGVLIRVLLMTLYGLIIDAILHCRLLFLKFDLYVNDTQFRYKTSFKVTARTFYSLKTALPGHKVILAFDTKKHKATIQTVKVELIDFDVEEDGSVKLYTFEEIV